MEDKIKQIAKFPKDSIRVAINSVLNNPNDKNKVEEAINAIADRLEKSAKKRKITRRCKPFSRMEIFRLKVIPQIRANAAKYERLEQNPGDINVNLNFDFITDLDSSENDLATLKTIHVEILEQEKMATQLHLVVVYVRGLLYMKMRKFMPREIIYEDWCSRELNLSCTPPSGDMYYSQNSF